MASGRWMAGRSLLLICVAVLSGVLPMEVERPPSGRMRERVKRTTNVNRLPCEERQHFVHFHNDVRANDSLRASNMQLMLWHSGLADMAQERVDGCNATVKPPGNSGLFPFIGQALYYNQGLNATVMNATEFWLSNAKYYNYDQNSCANENCKYYVQIIWASSANLGCAKNLCTEGIGAFIVCYYGPGGNMTAGKPYVNNGSCTDCPEGMKCENNLCVSLSKCGEKTCEDGKTLDKYCECPCEAVHANNGENVRDSLPPVCGAKTCENGEELNENCTCYCPDGSTCTGGTSNTNGNGTTKVGTITLYLSVCILAFFV